MPLFGRRAPRYNAPAGPIVVNQNQLLTTMRTRPSFTRYAAKIGLPLATIQAVRDIFSENIHYVPNGQFWGATNPRAIAGHEPNLRFQDQAALSSFIDVIENFIGLEISKIDSRQVYVNTLRNRAIAGQLEGDLRANTEPENNYYTAPAPRVAARGAPLIPAKTPWMIEQSKAFSWLTHGVTGDTSAYTSNLVRLNRHDGSNPIGADDTILRNAWSELVPAAPTHRGWNLVTIQSVYPSNIGGTKLLNDMLAEFDGRNMPPIGDNAWYDWALFIFGSMMAVQAFTDGNKRISRLAYALVLLSGGVPFVAPNGQLGARLASMM